MGGLGAKGLQALLAALATVQDSIAAVPDDLPPPTPRRTPAHLRRM